LRISYGKSSDELGFELETIEIEREEDGLFRGFTHKRCEDFGFGSSMQRSGRRKIKNSWIIRPRSEGTLGFTFGESAY
jgi:hypothetical protein